jgi:hypothetical protein
MFLLITTIDFKYKPEDKRKVGKTRQIGWKMQRMLYKS